MNFGWVWKLGLVVVVVGFVGDFVGGCDSGS